MSSTNARNAKSSASRLPARRARPAAPSAICAFEVGLSVAVALPGVRRADLLRFAARAGKASGLDGRIDVRITGNREMRELNRFFRRQDKPTDVLSFPAPAVAAGRLAGDIALSAEIAADNAARYRHPLATELKVLLLHGILHLAGYDHETDSGEMAARESELRAVLGLPRSLIDRAGAPSPQGRRARAPRQRRRAR